MRPVRRPYCQILIVDTLLVQETGLLPPIGQSPPDRGGRPYLLAYQQTVLGHTTVRSDINRL